MRLRLIVSLVTFVVSSYLVRAEAPRYRWQPNSRFVYQVDITADSPLQTDTMTGQVVFEVISASDPLKIKYQGGLSKTSKKKPGASSDRGGGPFADPFGAGGGNPFAQTVNPFLGLAQTKNEIVLSPTGEILAVTGSSQLPYLLGNLSLLFFEPLPESDQKSWKFDHGVVITKKGEQRGRADFFDPFARPPGNEQDQQSAGGHTTSFTLESERNGVAEFRRTYRLHSPGDGMSFTIDGSGLWTFNRSLGMSESLDFKQTLKIKSQNIEFSVPVAIKYRRLSNDEWTKMEADRIEASRPKSEDELYRAAIAKASSGTTTKADAERITVATKANLKPILDKEYVSANEAKVLGIWVTHDTPLPNGLIVAVNMYAEPETKYFPASIDSILDNGLIRVRYRYRGGATEERLREDIFIAPEVVEQPQLTPEQKTAVQAYRERVRQELENSPDGPEATERLIRSYRDGTQPVVKVGDPIPNDLPLPKFLVLAGKKADGKFYQVHVSGVQPDGKVAVRFSCDRVDTTIARSDLRLPPAEVIEPNVPPPYKTSTSRPSTTPTLASSATSKSDAFRTWTDNSGTFKVEAKLISTTADAVRIVRKDGKELTIPLTKLSDEDQRFVRALKKPENPFE